jgi:ABC-type multidrug transport system ATPase subunit
LLHEPRLVYLDEPTLGVDVQSRRAIWNYILGLKEQGRTILLTTNYLEEASALCDRLAILDHGKLVALDTPANLKRRFGNTVLELETAEPAPAALVERVRAVPGVVAVSQQGTALNVTLGGESSSAIQVVTLIAQESTLHGMSQREPNLDEVFLRLTGSDLRD